MFHKYRAQKTLYDGISFPSKLEAALYAILKAKEKGGEIKDIKLQQPVFLTEAKIKCIIDFSAMCMTTGKVIYIEAKGMATPVWSLKKKLWLHYGPGRLEIYSGSWTKPKLKESVVPKWMTTKSV